jgi:hypothetical protein
MATRAVLVTSRAGLSSGAEQASFALTLNRRTEPLTTMTVAVSASLPARASTWAVPAATPCAMPLPSTVTMEVLSERQSTSLSMVSPSVPRTTAVRCAVSPTAVPVTSGVTSTEPTASLPVESLHAAAAARRSTAR